MKRKSGAASTTASGVEAPTLREAWASWEESGRAFWTEMDAVVDMLDGLVGESEVADG